MRTESSSSTSQHNSAHLGVLFFWYCSLTHLMPVLVPAFTLCAPTSAAALALTNPSDAAAFTLPATVFLSALPLVLLLPLSSPEAHWSAKVGASCFEPMVTGDYAAVATKRERRLCVRANEMHGRKRSATRFLSGNRTVFFRISFFFEYILLLNFRISVPIEQQKAPPVC